MTSKSASKVGIENILDKEFSSARSAALSAGEKILEVSRSGDFGIEEKYVHKFSGEEDLDIVTRADRNSCVEICRKLIVDFPEYGLLCEENVESFNIFSNDSNNSEKLERALKEWNTREYCWIIDPLDGTKDFVKGSNQVGINIGLVKNGKPVLGIVYLPLQNIMYSAIEGNGAYRENFNDGIKKRIHVSDRLNILESVVTYSISNKDSLLDKVINNIDFRDVKKYAGPGLKLAKVAEGEVDLYLCFNGVPDTWDVCSGEIILHEAGGLLTDSNGDKFNYLNGTVLDKGIIGSNKYLHQKIISNLH